MKIEILHEYDSSKDMGHVIRVRQVEGIFSKIPAIIKDHEIHITDEEVETLKTFIENLDEEKFINRELFLRINDTTIEAYKWQEEQERQQEK